MKRFRRNAENVTDSHPFKATPFVPDGVWIPRAILAIASRFAVPLYLELRGHCYESPECWPSQRRLARRVGCSVATINRLIAEFVALGIIKRLHRGRHCVYRLAEGCWHRRKPRKSADRSTSRTEEITYGDSLKREPEPKKPEASQRFALAAAQRAERRAKRQNLIKTLRRWVQLSPHLPEDERPHRLAMLDRAEAALDNWHTRPAEDRRCFEMLVTRARAMPLDGACVQSLRQTPVGMPMIGAFVPVFSRIPANPWQAGLGAS